MGLGKKSPKIDFCIPEFYVNNVVIQGKLNLPPYLTPDARDLIRKFLKRQVNQRLGAGPTDADSIKTHPYFKVKL